MTPVIDLDLPAGLLAHLAAAPASITVVFAGRDPVFTAAMRSIFCVDGHTDTALVAVTADRTLALVPDGLIVTFTRGEAPDDVIVVPALLTVAPLARPPWPDGFAQAAIDAVQDLLLRRCEPVGRVQ